MFSPKVFSQGLHILFLPSHYINQSLQTLNCICCSFLNSFQLLWVQHRLKKKKKKGHLLKVNSSSGRCFHLGTSRGHQINFQFPPQIVTVSQTPLIYCLGSSLLCPVWFDYFPIVSLPPSICFWLFFYRHAPSHHFKLNLIFFFFFFLFHRISKVSRLFILMLHLYGCLVHLCVEKLLYILLMLQQSQYVMKYLNKTEHEVDYHMHSHARSPAFLWSAVCQHLSLQKSSHYEII